MYVEELPDLSLGVSTRDEHFSRNSGLYKVSYERTCTLTMFNILKNIDGINLKNFVYKNVYNKGSQIFCWFFHDTRQKTTVLKKYILIL